MLDYYGSSGMAGSSSSSQADPPPTAVDGASLGSLVWGSIERNTGTFCPYAETAEIEAAFARGDASIHLPGCFNATLHFRRDTLHHYQLTPAVGSKPAGFRSVVRGAAGDRVDIFWHASERLFRTEPPAAIDRQLVVELTPVPPPATHWQWCDLVGQAAASARECNWHSYDESVSGEIEGAWSARRPSLRFVIGLSEYEVRDFNGSYATQHNLATGGQRMVRRGRLDTGAALDPGLLDESCALCTECFADTPQWPVHKTPCGHSFHFTCVQHLLRRGGSARCPICRRALPHAGGGPPSAEQQMAALAAAYGGGGMDDWRDGWSQGQRNWMDR